MTAPAQGEVLWTPPDDVRERTQMGKFLTWLAENRDRRFAGYEELWEWSVTDLEGFWTAIWDRFEVISHAEPTEVIASYDMPGARWFPGATVNYAEHALRGRDDEVVLVARSQSRGERRLTRGELREQVARAREGLIAVGVGRGDCVAAYLPSIPEAVIAFLAAASLGAVWTACAPESGTASVLDRLGQARPKVLLAVGGYRYGSKFIDRVAELEEIRSALSSIETIVTVPYADADADVDHLWGTISWAELTAAEGTLTFDPLPFDHPLWVLFSSGTTGLPKPIVHGHGGILLEHFKACGLHHDLGPGDRFFFYATTAWMVWNIGVSALLVGASFVMLDGDPAYPDLLALWRVAEECDVSHLGVSASFVELCRKADLHPGRDLDLSRLRFIVSAGSPLPSGGFRWIQERVACDRREVFVTSGSGGTDICSGLVGSVPILPVYAGEMAGRWLGAAVEAWDPEGLPLIGELGELVVTRPIPSMPVSFLNDPDGERYRAAYFDVYPGIWRHGDWLILTSHGTAIITGRSDATLNRGGVRLGTSEFYAIVEQLPEVRDSLVVHLEDPLGGLGRLLLFVVLDGDAVLDDGLRARIVAELRGRLSPRHGPDEVRAVPVIPRNLTGKKLEVPVKRILLGADPETVVSSGSLRDPSALEAFSGYARDYVAGDRR